MNLIEQFKKAGLDLEILKEPLRKGRGMELIFQMDINRKTQGTRRWEKFRIWPGHVSNIIQIRDTDPKDKQILLLVSESKREYEDSVHVGKFNTPEKILNALKEDLNFIKIVSSSKTDVVVLRRVPAETRYFLLGVDERQLFVAQTKDACTTVAEARRSLGKSVEFADSKRQGKLRQGEWFFLETDLNSRSAIEEAIKSTKAVVVKNANIGQYLGRRGGNPHVADELVMLQTGEEVLQAGADTERLQRSRAFVRGKVKHVDHKTLKFNHWREVIANNEGATAAASAGGVFWVD